MFALFSQAVGFGFAAGTSFGPLHNLLMNVTLARGWRHGLLIALSPLLTDGPIILLALLVLRELPAETVRYIEIAGGLAILWIAWRGWQSYRQGAAEAAAEADARAADTSRATILKGMALNFLNPTPYIFWGTILGPLLLEALAQSALHVAALLGGFYGTFLGLMAAFALAFDRLRRLDPRLTRALSLLSVIVMVALGLSFLWRGLFAA